MNHWLTTILILLPVGGALLVALAPLPGYWLGSLASLISLVEVGFWITSAAKFDFAVGHRTGQDASRREEIPRGEVVAAARAVDELQSHWASGVKNDW